MCACSSSSQPSKRQSRTEQGGPCGPLTHSCRCQIEEALGCTMRASIQQAGEYHLKMQEALDCRDAHFHSTSWNIPSENAKSTGLYDAHFHSTSWNVLLVNARSPCHVVKLYLHGFPQLTDILWNFLPSLSFFLHGHLLSIQSRTIQNAVTPIVTLFCNASFLLVSVFVVLCMYRNDMHLVLSLATRATLISYLCLSKSNPDVH